MYEKKRRVMKTKKGLAQAKHLRQPFVMFKNCCLNAVRQDYSSLDSVLAGSSSGSSFTILAPQHPQ